jgi:hypothetical protein
VIEVLLSCGSLQDCDFIPLPHLFCLCSLSWFSFFFVCLFFGGITMAAKGNSRFVSVCLTILFREGRMLRRQPTRVEVSQVDRDELDGARKEKAKKDKPQFTLEHVEVDRNLPSKNARLGINSSN